MTTSAPSMSGHYAGFFTRSVAFVIDWIIITTSYGLMVAATQAILGPILGIEFDIENTNSVMWAVFFVSWAFLYLVVALTLTGKTLGKALSGLKVVTREGAPIGAGTAILRVIVLPLSFVLFGLGLLGVIIGKERRALHDMIAGTAVVYDWGDRPAAMPAPLTRYLERKGVMDSAASSEIETEATRSS